MAAAEAELRPNDEQRGISVAHRKSMTTPFSLCTALLRISSLSAENTDDSPSCRFFALSIGKRQTALTRSGATARPQRE